MHTSIRAFVKNWLYLWKSSRTAEKKFSEVFISQ
jgi:hypothetical protein